MQRENVYRAIVVLIGALIPLVPVEHQEHVWHVVEFIGANSVLVLGLKALLGYPKPTDGQLKHFAYNVVGFLEYFAANTETVKSARARSVPPPKSYGNSEAGTITSDDLEEVP